MIALAVHLLQSTACAACIALVALAFRRNPARTRHALWMQRVLRGMVIDDTGLTGKYYFATEFAQENHPPEVDLPSIFAALQEDLGLKLEKRKSEVEMLVVDRIDRIPTEN
jgi:uncharacterized protein (TIGR03435 family)